MPDIPVINSHPTRKTGVRRVSNERYDHVMKFGAFRKEGVTLPSLFDADYLAQVAAKLQMLGNDKAGDCEAVRWANNRFLNTSVLTDTPVYPTQDEVWTVYKTQNPGFVPGTGPHGYGSNDDQGMDSLKLLDYLQKTGGPDGAKVVAYATVDETNLAEVAAAIDTFGSVWVDIVVLDGNQNEFGEGKPWTDDDSGIDGGHAVLGAGITLKPVTSVSKYVDIATWAAETSLSESFWNGSVQGQRLVMGVYVVIWEENLGTRQFHEGIDAALLQQVYGAVTDGKTLPLPDPAPSPDPSPTPTPDPGAAPFPGATVPVATHVDHAAATHHLSTTEWLNRHLSTYFGIHDQAAEPHQVIAGREIEQDEPGEREGYRDAGSGKFVTEEYAEVHPDTTEKEQLD